MKSKASIIERFKAAQDSLVLQAADLSLEAIAGMVKSKAIDIKPTYQRRVRWSPEKQSALIESFLLNVPVPPIYLSEEEFGVYSAIDGKQRITSITDFMRGRLKLQKLETFTEIEGATFKDLPTDLQNALRVRPYLRAITLLKQSDPDLKYEVFTRLNKQGVPLNAQEIRNVIYRGPLNDLIFELSQNSFLRQQLKIKDDRSKVYLEMADAEYVLRFLTLHEDLDGFQESFRRSMDAFMKKRKRISKADLVRLRELFETSMTACQEIWGDHAFRRVDGNTWRDQFLGGMYDAQMLAVARVKKGAIQRATVNNTKVMSATQKLFTDATFEAAVREATNTRTRIDYRVEQVVNILNSV